MNEPAIMTFNKYGYRLNLNNNQIRRLYERYKDSKGLPYNMGISDEQRRDFERSVMIEYRKLYRAHYGTEYIYPGDDCERERMNELINRITLSRKED